MAVVGKKRTKMLYIAGPMDDTEEGHDPVSWRNDCQIAAALEGMCCVWTNQQSSREFAKEAILACRSLIYVADGMVVSLDGGFPFGTIREIEYAAFQLGKPVVVVSKEFPLSFFMADLFWEEDLPRAMASMREAIDNREKEQPVDWMGE